MIDEAQLREFYENLSDRPLEVDDPLYVPIHTGPSSGDADPIQRIARAMTWNPLESAQLLSGFRGTGKSTELLRLRRLLNEQGFKVVLCDMRRYLNLSTKIDVSDFLICAAGAVSDSLREDPELLGTDLLRRGYWERAKDFLTRTEVKVDALSLSGDGSAIKLGLREDPSFRETVQEQLKGHLGALADDVRAFIADCVKALRDRHGGETKIAILFDSIEQIRGGSTDADGVFKSVEILFAGHPDKLRFEGVHVVYTVPPWLKIRAPGVTKLYDGSYTLPCVKIQTREGEPFEPGLEALREIVQKRGKHWRQVLGSQDELDHILRETGGYLRDLFRVLQATLMRAADDLEHTPLDRRAIDFELAQLRNDYLPIATQDAQWLAKVARSHAAELPEHDKIPDLSRYFDSHLLLCYRNGDEWYDIHPLIRDEVERQSSRAATEADEAAGT